MQVLFRINVPLLCPQRCEVNIRFPPSPPGQIHQREQEIAELKQKIAEVMAVMPSLSYSSDGSNLSPVTPHYSSKFMDNSPSSLDPNASVYQPLKKWLWRPHFSSFFFFVRQNFVFFFVSVKLSVPGFELFLSLSAPDSFCTVTLPHNDTPTHSATPPYICAFGSFFFWFYYENYYFERGCVQYDFYFVVLSFGI